MKNILKKKSQNVPKQWLLLEFFFLKHVFLKSHFQVVLKVSTHRTPFLASVKRGTTKRRRLVTVRCAQIAQRGGAPIELGKLNRGCRVGVASQNTGGTIVRHPTLEEITP